MANFNGKWELTSSDNLIAALKACGVAQAGLDKAKGLEVTGSAGLTEEFKYTGTALERTMYKPDGSVQSKGSVTAGQWTDGTTLDGRKITVKLTILSDSEFSREEKGDGYTANFNRKVSGNEMTMTMTVGGQTCVRKYKRM